MGAIGLGLVCGWLLILLIDPDRVSAALVSKLVAATALVCIEVLVMAGGRSLVLFIAAAAVALMLHLGWKREARYRAVHRID